jgi:hypothetical protein
MPIRSFIGPGAFDPETVATMSVVLDAACEKVGDTDQPEVAREVIAGRIIAAANLVSVTPLACWKLRFGDRARYSAAVPERKVAQPFKEILPGIGSGQQTPASNPP